MSLDLSELIEDLDAEETFTTTDFGGSILTVLEQIRRDVSCIFFQILQTHPVAS